jgi:hypothetical protein
MDDPSNGIPHWSVIKNGSTPHIPADPLRLNMSKINKAFRKQDRIKDLQKYECIIQDFEEFKLLAKKDYVTFFISFFSNLVSDKQIRPKIKQLFKKFNEKNGPENFLAHLQQNFKPKDNKEFQINTNILNIQVPNIPNMNNKQPQRNSSILTKFEYEPQNRNSNFYKKTSESDLYVQVSPISEDKQTAFYKLFWFYGLNSAPFKSSFFVNFDPIDNPDKIILYNIEKTSSLSQKLIMVSMSKTQQVKEIILKFMKYLLELIGLLHSFGIIIGNLDCSNIRYFFKTPDLYTFLIDSFSDSSYFPDVDKYPSEFNKKLLESFQIIANILIYKIYNPT